MGGEGEEGRGGLFATLAVLPCSRAHLIHRLNHVLGGGKMLVIKRIRRSRADRTSISGSTSSILLILRPCSKAGGSFSA